MNRFSMSAAVVLATLLSLAGAIAIGPSLLRDTSAQGTPTAGHPLVGAWTVDADLSRDDNRPETVAFDSDGTFIDAQTDGTTAIGVWEPTGATTATLTFSNYDSDKNETLMGTAIIRVSIEVSADGTTFTGEYTIEFVNPDGTTSGEAGPATVTGTRVVAQAPGTPVMTMDELFGPVEGSPEASPVS